MNKKSLLNFLKDIKSFNGETYRYGNNKVVIEKVSLGNREKRAHITQFRLTRSSSVSSTTSN